MKAYLEITDVCNRACSFCPGTKREKSFVKPDVFAKRLDALPDAVDEIFLHVLGEPLLHPDFSEIAECCRRRGIPVTLTTNGTLLDDEKAAVLLTNPVFRQVNFSLQALEEKETDELKKILSFCLRAQTERPELYVNLRMWTLEDDFSFSPKEKTFLSIIFKRLSVETDTLPKFHKKWRSLPLGGRIYLNCNTLFDWPVNTLSNTCTASGNTGNFCQGLVSQFAVLCDGTVVPCCLDSEGLIPLGNVDTEPLGKILSSPRANAIRKGFTEGRAVEELCRKCTFHAFRGKGEKRYEV